MPWCEVLGGGCCCGLVLEGDHYLLSLNLLGLKGFYRWIDLGPVIWPSIFSMSCHYGRAFVRRVATSQHESDLCFVLIGNAQNAIQETGNLQLNVEFFKSPSTDALRCISKRFQIPGPFNASRSFVFFLKRGAALKHMVRWCLFPFGTTLAESIREADLPSQGGMIGLEWREVSL